MILISSRLTDYYRSNAKFALWMQRTVGVLFVGLGARLAIIER
jgi:threonine/homoserine/homoserine lactone efflux protein